MKSWIRNCAAVVGTLWLLGSVQAAPPPPPGAERPPSRIPREMRSLPEQPPPGLVIRPVCNTGPAPQPTVEIKKVYVGLKWAAVPNARTYYVYRKVAGSNLAADGLAPDPYVTTEYWDAVPDTRNNYEYTVVAVQPDGCIGSTKVAVNGPYALPHPSGTGGGHPTPGQVILSWSEQFGATGYRIDGPGIPNTGLYLPGTTFIPGKKPWFVGAPTGASYNNEPVYNMSVAVTGQGVAGSLYRIFALYPQAADYNTAPTKIYVPRVAPVITSIAPTSGIIGQTMVTIRGQFLSDPSDSPDHAPRVKFGAPSNPYLNGGTSTNVTSVSPTEITAVASASGLVQVTAYGRHPDGGPSPSSGRSQQGFSGTQAPPPPAQPPPSVRVPGVIGLSFNGAVQVLQNAGFMPLAGSGPNGPGTVVQTQQPQGGAMAPQGSVVTINSVALAGGLSEITLYNNMQQQHSVNAWLFDMASGSWSANAAIAFGSTTKFDLLSGRTYFILVLDPAKCGGQNDPANAACEYWRLPGVPGDENGPKTTVPIN